MSLVVERCLDNCNFFFFSSFFYMWIPDWSILNDCCRRINRSLKVQTKNRFSIFINITLKFEFSICTYFLYFRLCWLISSTPASARTHTLTLPLFVPIRFFFCSFRSGFFYFSLFLGNKLFLIHVYWKYFEQEFRISLYFFLLHTWTLKFFCYFSLFIFIVIHCVECIRYKRFMDLIL